MKNSTLAAYTDNDIVLFDDISKLPHSHNSIKLDSVLIIGCQTGKMSISMNAEKFTIHPNDVLICPPNIVLNDFMTSLDFNGAIVCFSQKIMHELIHVDNGTMDKAFRLKENPVIHVDKDGVELFQAYHNLVKLRSHISQRAYGKEVIASLARAALYEIMAELSNSVEPSGREQIRQKDVLFKRFMALLSSCEVKPRTVAWYGEQLYVTPKYLSTVCKAVSGKTAFDWINAAVMTDIRRLLKYSDSSIKELTDYLGFPNISFFGKYVKAHTGFSPTDYRKQLRETEKEE